MLDGSGVELAQAEEAITGESPLWDDRRGIVWWIDIQGRRLLGFSPKAGPIAPMHLPSEPGLVALADDDSLIVGLEDGLWRLFPETGALKLLTPVTSPHPDIRLNDGKPDWQGRLWFGSMDKSGSGIPHGALYCRHPGGRLETVRQGVRVPNAIAVSRDGGTLYFSDSPSQQVLAFDLDQSSGALGNERVFRTFTGTDKPDGACIDANNGLWIAVVNGARLDHLNADGHLIESVPMPVAKPTMCVFGGSELSDLFITSQRRFLSADQLAQHPLTGALLRVRTSSRGTPPNRVRI
ncbi:SMP-30/gluconolactonase/LRE family protein [Devosia nitrariae]|uniref:Gluconolactonase n=1 Tax=Devosia nitrariae TaxID=2071872 RepID=A0ABQ5W7F0_9HYPH|nr:SMP-30/gluconolactonase/LRE family protein [Devosia nitrariae]GLQ55860.1 gluconolactonase [Devosia nitrariae]